MRQIASEHRISGSQLEIVCCDPPSAPFLGWPAFPVHPQGHLWVDRFFPLSFLRWLRRHHNEYDVVVVNGIWGFHLLATHLALKRSATPFLVFSHGMLDPWFRRRYPPKHLKKWLVWPWAIHPPLHNAYAVCFTCEQERVLARQSFWLYNVNEAVVDYGTQGIPDPGRDYATPFLQQHSPLAGRQRLLFLGRVAPKKAPDLLLYAIAALQREGIWDPAAIVLVLAGPAHCAYATKLICLAEQLGITPSIHWTGMLQGDQKWGAFQAADAFVLPSHQENFGIAVAEALSCSTPVLLCNPVNIAPDIAADHAGFVEPDTPAGVTCLLRRWFALLADERAAMRHKARVCFESHYQIRSASISVTRLIHNSILECKLATGSPSAEAPL